MEETIREYFSAWIGKDAETVKRVFAQDIIYSECYGPEYHGLNQILRWFDDWNKEGSVLEWPIKRTIEKGNTIVVEWYFKCDYRNRVSGFDGVTIADFNDEGKIVEENTPAEIFDHPKSERLKSFLSKVL